MKKLDKKGFSAIEVLLALVIIGAIGFVGWYVWQAKNNTNKTLNDTAQGTSSAQKITPKTTTVADETADWYLYQPPGKEYSIKLADGWALTRYSESSSLYQLDNQLAIKTGTRATVTESDGGKDFDTALVINFQADQPTTTGFIQLDSMKTDQGKDMSVYMFTQTTDPEAEAVPKGGKEYEYFVKGTNGYFYSQYSFGPDQTDYHTTVEKVLKTVSLD